MTKIYEMVYIKDVDTCPSKLYNGTDRPKVNADFQLISASGKPLMLRGVDEVGEVHTHCVNGFDETEIALTANVDYGYGPKTFLAHRHYEGMYEVRLRSGKTQVVSVNFTWRTLESLEYEKIEKDFDSFKWFEDIVIRKIN